MGYVGAPEDLAFDPVASKLGQVRVVAMIEEPGTRPPHGTVERLEVTWAGAAVTAGTACPPVKKGGGTRRWWGRGGR